MEDKFSKGFWAGLAGALAMNFIDYIFSYLLHVTQRRFLDYAAVLIYGRLANNIWEAIFAQLTQILFSSILGIVFAYFLERATDKNYLLKGWIFAIAIWLLVFTMGLLYRLPLLWRPASETAFAHFIGSSIYGLVLAYSLHKLDKKSKLIR